MKTYLLTLAAAAMFWPAALCAEDAGEYAKDIAIVLDSQKEAMGQAEEALAHADSRSVRAALQDALKEMERSQGSLESAKTDPAKLPAALEAEQAAYQDLLKATPREYRLRRSRPGQSGGSGSGQPNQQEINQLDTTADNNRYESESQAAPEQTARQRAQSETLDRLKQLARRQQDLNDRLRDLQTALQEAKTDQDRDEVQRQIKRLRDEERQMLSDMDALRQKMEQSPEAANQAQARQQLDRTRQDVEKAAQSLESKAVSQALASGARAEENLQDLRENLRQQSSSQFARQMRQMRQEARDLAESEEKLGQDLDKLNQSGEKSLDDSAPRQAVVDQMGRQENALTNLLGQMRAVTEQAENTEPLLAKQLYDSIRRTDQARADNQLEVGAQLAERGFLPQAAEAEQAARQSINQLRKDVDRAADSVLGSEADALRFAQKQLDTLGAQLAEDLASATNNPGSTNGGAVTSNRARAGTARDSRPGSQRENPGSQANQQHSPNSPGQSATDQANTTNQSAQAGQRDQSGNSAQANSSSSSPGQSTESPDQTAQAGQNGRQSGRRSDSAGQRGQNGQGGQRNSNQQPGAADSDQAQAGGSPTGGSDADRLRDFARQLGASGGAGGLGENGPITGNDYVDWVERMRDVEESVDSPDVRNQLAAVREQVGVYRRFYRQSGRLPTRQELQTKALAPLALARNWVMQELARSQDEHSLVPLDRDPEPEKYTDAVRKYYEELGSPQ